MAVDYLARLTPTGEGRGAAAYHDKRFALLAALQDFGTAIYVDADSRITALPQLGIFPSGLAGLPESKRLPIPERIAAETSRLSLPSAREPPVTATRGRY
jgi:hypothetical protein